MRLVHFVPQGFDARVECLQLGIPRGVERGIGWRRRNGRRIVMHDDVEHLHAARRREIADVEGSGGVDPRVDVRPGGRRGKQHRQQRDACTDGTCHHVRPPTDRQYRGGDVRGGLLQDVTEDGRVAGTEVLHRNERARPPCSRASANPCPGPLAFDGRYSPGPAGPMPAA